MAMGDKGRLDRTLNLDEKKRLVTQMSGDQSTEGTTRLVEMLKDESWYVRSLASQALIDRGRPAVPLVLGVLGGQLWFTRAAALTVLSKIGATECVDTAVATLTDGNRTVREAAVDALLQLAGDGSSRIVGQALARVDERCTAAFFDRARAAAPGVAEAVTSHMRDAAPAGQLAALPVLNGARS